MHSGYEVALKLEKSVRKQGSEEGEVNEKSLGLMRWKFMQKLNINTS